MLFAVLLITSEQLRKGINGAYADGLSITLGNTCKHVWTYAAGLSEVRQSRGLQYTFQCPCASSPGTPPHPFIGGHYHCESVFAGSEWPLAVFYTIDPLWDGSGCVNANTNCCANPSMPWFH